MKNVDCHSYFCLVTFKLLKFHINTASLALFPLSGGSGCGGGDAVASLSGDLETFMPPPSSSHGRTAMSPVCSHSERAFLALPEVLRCYLLRLTTKEPSKVSFIMRAYFRVSIYTWATLLLAVSGPPSFIDGATPAVASSSSSSRRVLQFLRSKRAAYFSHL